MSMYEYLQTAKDLCQEKAKAYMEVEDLNLTIFYMAAAEGFRRKAEKLQVGKACQK